MSLLIFHVKRTNCIFIQDITSVNSLLSVQERKTIKREQKMQEKTKKFPVPLNYLVLKT